MNKFRYIDKKILCSYDLSEEFFKELGVEVYDIIPLRKVFVIFTDKVFLQYANTTPAIPINIIILDKYTTL